jgi:dipeptidyl aminopeptidase/acylaminoacyl peptidase
VGEGSEAGLEASPDRADGAGDADGALAGRVTAPFGSWASPISIDLVAGSAVELAEPQVDGDDVLWLEGRPCEGGRWTLLRRTPDGATRELTPDPFRVGNRVHEYGGGSYVVSRGRVVVSSLTDGRLWECDPAGVRPPRSITPEGPWRYADLRLDPVRPVLYAVRETHDPVEDLPSSVRNEIVALALDGSDGPGRVLVAGPDFVAAPRPSPDGALLAWLEWDHPDMPWDATRLRVAEIGPDGSPVAARTVAGGPGISVMQPAWSPTGVLHAVSDVTGWWNLHAFDGPAGIDGPARNLAPMAAEVGDPAWVLGRCSFAFLADGSLLAVARAGGRDGLVRIGADGAVEALETPFTEIEALQAGEAGVVAVAAGPRDGPVVLRLDPRSGAAAGVLARSLSAPLDAAVLPHPEAITFRTTGGATARALFFPPANEAFRGPAGQLPPLLVLSHGGPTSAASSALSLDHAFFTSRGIAVVDVDYRGSTGYGRPYREALKGQWGIVDVDDCVAAARHLADRGIVDPDRMAIRGGSAGGFTTLAALAFRPDVFAAGISRYGIADLELIHKDSHKFEASYEEGLVAPWPAGRQVYRDRSPIHVLDRVRAPMLLLQGLDDRVVPPSQLEAMVDAFTAGGLPHVAMTFEGEGHGFRRAETKRAVFRAELAFLGRVFGFTPADGIEPLEVPGLGLR